MQQALVNFESYVHHEARLDYWARHILQPAVGTMENLVGRKVRLTSGSSYAVLARAASTSRNDAGVRRTVKLFEGPQEYSSDQCTLVLYPTVIRKIRYQCL